MQSHAVYMHRLLICDAMQTLLHHIAANWLECHMFDYTFYVTIAIASVALQSSKDLQYVNIHELG